MQKIFSRLIQLVGPGQSFCCLAECQLRPIREPVIFIAFLEVEARNLVKFKLFEVLRNVNNLLDAFFINYSELIRSDETEPIYQIARLIR